MSQSLPEIVHLASRGCIIDMVLKEILVIGKHAKTYRRLGGLGRTCLVLSNTRRGWANVPRWGERQRRWLAALLPLP